MPLISLPTPLEVKRTNLTDSFEEEIIQIQEHLSTYFEASHSDVYLDHDAIGIELQLYVPDIVSMGFKTFMTHYKYYLSMFNVTVPKVYNKYQGPKIVAPFHLLFALKSLDDFKI